MREVSITPEQRKKFNRIGRKLIKKKLTKGYQLEDHPYDRTGTRIIYGHDTLSHTDEVKQLLQKKYTSRYPRESYYKWDRAWGMPKKGGNTVLVGDNQYAKAEEHYLVVKGGVSSTNDKLFSRTFRNRPNHIKYSWYIPDIRVYGRSEHDPRYKDAYLITKKIDNNSRLSTIAPTKKKKDMIRKELKYERVKKIKVQDVPKSSFWDFINGV